MPKVGQPVGFLGRLLKLLLKIGSPLIGNILKPLAKTVLIPLWLIAAASATDAGIHKKIFGSGVETLIIWNKKINDTMKILEPLEESGLLIKKS